MMKPSLLDRLCLSLHVEAVLGHFARYAWQVRGLSCKNVGIFIQKLCEDVSRSDDWLSPMHMTLPGHSVDLIALGIQVDLIALVSYANLKELEGLSFLLFRGFLLQSALDIGKVGSGHCCGHVDYNLLIG